MDLANINLAEIQTALSSEKPLGRLLVLIAAAVLVPAFRFVLHLVTKRLARLASHTHFIADDILASCLGETRTWFIASWILVPLIWLVENSPTAVHIGRGILVLATSAQICIWGLKGIFEWRDRIWSKKVENNASSAAAFGLVYTFLRGLLIVGVVLMALSNLGVNIGALITGLGIGGIAVALAAQNVLGDLFASLSIVLDKPFVVGDYIVAGDEEGEVETIGIKTTRVRSISGEELIFSNKDLLGSRIRNYKRMWQRRVVQKFSISARTPLHKIKEIPTWVQSFFDNPKLKFDRCHLMNMQNSVMNFDLVFWVKDTSYATYMNLQQELLWKIIARFEQENVPFESNVSFIHLDQQNSLTALFDGKDESLASIGASH